MHCLCRRKTWISSNLKVYRWVRSVFAIHMINELAWNFQPGSQWCPHNKLEVTLITWKNGILLIFFMMLFAEKKFNCKSASRFSRMHWVSNFFPKIRILEPNFLLFLPAAISHIAKTWHVKMWPKLIWEIWVWNIVVGA